jgi:hypothetical protein
VSHLPIAHGRTNVIQYFDFESGNYATRTSGAYVARPIRDEDMTDFGGSKAIEQLHVICISPAIGKSWSKNLSGCYGKPQAMKAFGRRRLQQISQHARLSKK